MKNLKVNRSFSVLDKGDILVPVNNGEDYEIECSEDYTDHCEGQEYKASFNSKFSISKSYAEELIKRGILSTVEENKRENDFKNVFEEIDNLINEYTKTLNNIDKDCEDCPECVKLEKTTVLKNCITVLNYLKSLKK